MRMSRITIGILIHVQQPADGSSIARVGRGEVTDAGFEGERSASSGSVLEGKRRFVPSLFHKLYYLFKLLLSLSYSL